MRAGGEKFLQTKIFSAMQVLGGTYMSLRDNLFIEPDESVNSSLSDLQGGMVREKVITNKETYEHQVIYGSLDGGGRS